MIANGPATAARLLELYRGRETVHAVAHITGSNGDRKVEYRPVHRPLTVEDLERHIKGELVVGVYPIRSDSKCLFAAIDVDLEESADLGLGATLQLHDAAIRLGFPTAAMLITFSGRKGHHLDLFFAEPINAGSVRLLLEAIETGAGFESGTFELFPKQDAIDPNVPTSLGNLIKLPLAIHPLTGKVAAIVTAPKHVEPATATDVFKALEGYEPVVAADAAREPRKAPQADYPKQHRTKRIEQLAGFLNREGLTLEAALKGCLDENEEHCDPPLSVEKVDETVRGIYGRYADQHRKGPDLRGGEVKHGASAEVGTTVPNPLLFKSARQRAAEKPPNIDWIIGGLAAAGAASELDGPQKQGKTTFLAHAVRAKLDGKPFLGLPTRPGPVVWLSEESWNVLQEPLGEAGLLDRDDLYLLCREDAFGLPWADLAAAARRFTGEVGANLLIGDTLSSLAGLKGDEENSSGSAMEAVRPVQEIAANGTAVIVTRHDRRAGGDVGESGRGSTAFAGAVDLIFRFKRLGGDGRATMRRLEYVGRIRGVPAERILELTDSGYQFVGTDADVKLQEAKDLLLDHLPDSEEDAVSLPSLWARAREATDRKPAAEAGPLAGSEIGKTTFRDAADALLGAGRLAKKEISARNHLWWCVSGAPVPTGHVGNESVGEREAGDVSGGPSPIRTDTPDTRTPVAVAPDVEEDRLELG